MELNYKILFSIELLHEYFADGKARNVFLSPSYDTQKLFNNIGILWRNIENKYFALIEVDQENEPALNRVGIKRFRSMVAQRPFRFYLKTNDSYFFNYTNLKFSGGHLYCFNNLTENDYGHPSCLYLSKKIDVYQPDKNYAQGDYVMDSSTSVVYESLANQDSEPLNQKSKWRNKGAIQVTTQADQLTGHFESFYNFPLSKPLAKGKSWPSVKIFSFDPKSTESDLMTLVAELDLSQRTGSTKVEQTIKELKIPLNDVPFGLCELQVGTEKKRFYYDRDMKEQNYFGLVEIYSHLKDEQSFSFLDAIEKVIGKDYIIRLPNRSVLWKYIRKDSNPAEIRDASEEFSFTLKGDSFVSNVPIPLQEKVRDTFSLNFTEGNKAIAPLPNASIYRLSVNEEGQTIQSNLCSEIHLNY